MSARDWKDQLTAYIDGELGAEEARQLEHALATDAELKALEQRLRTTIGAMKSLEHPAASPALRRAVMNAVSVPTLSERLHSFFTPSRVFPLAMAAGAAVAVLITISNERSASVGGGGGDPLLAAQTGGEVESIDDRILVAQNMEMLEDMELLDLDAPGDIEVIAALHELKEVTP